MEEEIPFSLSIWTVKDGFQGDFAELWESFALWTGENMDEAGFGYLLQSTEDPNMFVSFGDWVDRNSITRWRDTKEFQEFMAKAEDLCEKIDPHIMLLAATSEEEEEE